MVDKFDQLVYQTNAILENLQTQVESIRYDGRGDSNWISNETDKAVAKARDRIKQNQVDRQLLLIRERAMVREMVKQPQDFAQRQYHALKAQSLLQGADGERMIKTYQQLMDRCDPEIKKHKKEYEDYITMHIDPDYHGQYDDVRRQNMTFDEEVQQRELAGLEVREKDLQMIEGMEQIALTEVLETGKTGEDISFAYNESKKRLDNVKDQMTGVKPQPTSQQMEDVRNATKSDKI